MSEKNKEWFCFDFLTEFVLPFFLVWSIYLLAWYLFFTYFLTNFVSCVCFFFFFFFPLLCIRFSFLLAFTLAVESPKRQCLREEQQNVKPDTPAIRGIHSRQTDLTSCKTSNSGMSLTFGFSLSLILFLSYSFILQLFGIVLSIAKNKSETNFCLLW